MKKNNTFKLALLMALVAGEAFAATTRSRSPGRRPVAGRKLGRLSAHRQKTNSGVQGQEIALKKLDADKVKQYMNQNAAREIVKKLESLKLNDMQALNIQGIRSKQGVHNVVRKIEALAKKAPIQPVDNKASTKPVELTNKEREDLLKKIDDLTKKLAESNKTGTNGSSDEITKLKKTIEEKEDDIDGYEAKIKKLNTLNKIVEDDSSGNNALKKALTELIDPSNKKLDIKKLNKMRLDDLAKAMGGEKGLSDIPKLGELKTAAEGATDFNGLSKFATQLNTSLGHTFLGAKSGQKLQNVLKYLKDANNGDKARNVAALQKVLGDLPIYEWAGDDDLKVTTGAVKDKRVQNNNDNAPANDTEITTMLKGKKFIVVDGDKLGDRMHQNQEA